MERDGISYMEVGSSGATIGTAMKRFEGFSQGVSTTMSGPL